MKISDILCDTLCISDEDILNFSITAPYRYKVYEIPKRSGKGTRTIAHPSKELKFIQRLLVSILDEYLPVHTAAFAYRKGLSIRDNASQHLKSKYLLKMDFKDFFLSITPDLFFAILSGQNIDICDSDRILLSRLLFWRQRGASSLKLSVGAPSSPLVSNFVMYDFDCHINQICSEQSIVYTRYADDITFSTNRKNLLFTVPDIVTQALINYTFDRVHINQDKTVFSSKAHNRHVTGITLTNDDKLSIGRERKRIISSMIHKYKNNMLDEDQILELKGKIAFSKHVEPDFYTRMCKKYGDEILTMLVK